MLIISSVTYILRIISLLQHCVDYQLINLRHCVDYLLSTTLCTISYNIIRIISSSIDNYIVIHSLIRKLSNFQVYHNNIEHILFIFHVNI